MTLPYAVRAASIPPVVLLAGWGHPPLTVPVRLTLTLLLAYAVRGVRVHLLKRQAYHATRTILRIGEHEQVIAQQLMLVRESWRHGRPWGRWYHRQGGQIFRKVRVRKYIRLRCEAEAPPHPDNPVRAVYWRDLGCWVWPGPLEVTRLEVSWPPNALLHQLRDDLVKQTLAFLRRGPGQVSWSWPEERPVRRWVLFNRHERTLIVTADPLLEDSY